jgi:hypothetical protein
MHTPRIERRLEDLRNGTCMPMCAYPAIFSGAGELSARAGNTRDAAFAQNSKNLYSAQKTAWQKNSAKKLRKKKERVGYLPTRSRRFLTT